MDGEVFFFMIKEENYEIVGFDLVGYEKNYDIVRFLMM
jgi:hypothetical protein